MAIAGAACLPASWGAGALLHPTRHHVTVPKPPGAQDVVIDGAGVKLRGWLFRGPGARRGTVVYLHGVADNRASGRGIADHFLARGFDVLAYDSRTHGESDGDACTYGYYEKFDLSRAIDTLSAQPVVAFGASLGAAVGLQAAAMDRRITAVVAVACFADLRTVATERAPSFATPSQLDAAFLLAEQQAHFHVNDVSPEAAARTIGGAVFLIHGEADHETPPEHSRRIYRALQGPKRLLIVPGAGHNDALRPEVWKEIDAWLESVVPARPGTG